MSKGRVVILTAMNLEYEAVRDRMGDLQVHWHRAGTRFETGSLGLPGCEVALVLSGKGNHPAAVLAERAIAEFAPAAVLFVGVAGALRRSVELGDVVVASQVYAYHGGTSEDDGLKSRPRTWETEHRAAQIAQEVIRSRNWLDVPDPSRVPKAHFGAIAAGEIVQDSTISAEAAWIRTHYADALAIEMEAAGVAQAAHLNRALPVVVIRGISDLANGEKAVTDKQNWQPRAAAHAAAFAAALAPRLVQQIGEGSPPTAAEGERPATATYSNIAWGNARVGFQAGQIHGNVHTGQAKPPADAAAAVDELRSLLKEAHRDGYLSAEDYAAAETELQIARSNSSDVGKALVALKRFRGLVSEIPRIAARVGAVIDGMRGAA